MFKTHVKQLKTLKQRKHSLESPNASLQLQLGGNSGRSLIETECLVFSSMYEPCIQAKWEIRSENFSWVFVGL